VCATSALPMAALQQSRLGEASAAKSSTATACISCGRNRHAGALSRAGLTHKRTGNRFSSAVMGGVTAVFEMPNTDPLTVSNRLHRQGEARPSPMHCDFAFFIGGIRDNVQICRNWSEPPAAPASRCSSARHRALLVEDDESLRRIFKVIRRRAAFHAEDIPPQRPQGTADRRRSAFASVWATRPRR